MGILSVVMKFGDIPSQLPKAVCHATSEGHDLWHYDLILESEISIIRILLLSSPFIGVVDESDRLQ